MAEGGGSGVPMEIWEKKSSSSRGTWGTRSTFNGGSENTHERQREPRRCSLPETSLLTKGSLRDTGQWDENDRCGTEISRRETWALQVMEYLWGMVLHPSARAWSVCLRTDDLDRTSPGSDAEGMPCPRRQ
eukprot:EG_transcript_47284